MSKPAITCLLAALLLMGCDQNQTLPDTSTDTSADTPTDSAPDTADDTADDSVPDTAPDTAPDTPGDPADDSPDAVTARVQFDTTMGLFVVGLYGNAAPITVDNFMTYVDDGFYSGLIFHRVIADFMIQGGGYDESLTRMPTNPAIVREIIPWLNHVPGVISMARTDDPDSATSQFFICVDTETGLDTLYAAFGEVESGYDVVESISLVETHSAGGMGDVPVTAVVMTSVTRL